MIVKELRELLACIPDDAQVWALAEHGKTVFWSTPSKIEIKTVRFQSTTVGAPEKTQIDIYIEGS